MFEHIAYHETTLPNGLRVLTAQNVSIPVLDVAVWTRTGYRYENPDELGYAHLLEHMLFGGTKRRPTLYDLSLEVERKGGYFNAFTNQASVNYEMQMMSSDGEFMVDILSDIFFNSLLNAERLETEKSVVLQELKQAQENHGAYIGRWAMKKVLPGHPVSHNILDTENTTREATSERLRAYLETHYRPDQSVIVFAGDIEHEQAVALVHKYFGHWAQPDQPFDPGLTPMPRAEENYYFQHRDIKQTFIDLSYYCNPENDLKTNAAWRMMNGFLSVGSTSILNHELREKRGFVYGVGAGRLATNDVGVYGISTSTQKPKEVLALTEQIIADIPTSLTPDVFERVRGQAIGSFVRHAVKPGSLADDMGSDFISFNRLVSPEDWIDHLKAVTREESIEMAQKYLTPDNSVLVLLGPEDIGRAARS